MSFKMTLRLICFSFEGANAHMNEKLRHVQTGWVRYRHCFRNEGEEFCVVVAKFNWTDYLKDCPQSKSFLSDHDALYAIAKHVCRTAEGPEEVQLVRKRLRRVLTIKDGEVYNSVCPGDVDDSFEAAEAFENRERSKMFWNSILGPQGNVATRKRRGDEKESEKTTAKRVKTEVIKCE